MKYNVDIKVENDAKLNDYLASLDSKRSRSEIFVNDGIHINAEDATALRASFDSVCQTLKIWEDSGEIR